MYKCITQRTRINFYRQYWKRQLFFLFKRKQCFVRVISLLLTPPEERKWLPEWPVVVDSIQHVLWHQQDNDWLTSSDKNTWITLCSLNYRRKKTKTFCGTLTCELRLIFDAVLHRDNYSVASSKSKKRRSLHYTVELVVVISFNINY